MSLASCRKKRKSIARGENRPQKYRYKKKKKKVRSGFVGNADNPRRGASFEDTVLTFFDKWSLKLRKGFPVPVGAGDQRKNRKFDLGCEAPQTLVECKNHTWTESGNAPSAKFSVWNEAMLYFMVSRPDYRKILAVLLSVRNGESLAAYYVKRFKHLVPSGVEIWEISSDGKEGHCVFPSGTNNKTR